MLYYPEEDEDRFCSAPTVPLYHICCVIDGMVEDRGFCSVPVNISHACACEKEIEPMPAQSSRRRRQPVRSLSQQQVRQQQQRQSERSALQPVDYSLDYAYVRRDLKRIVIWSALLFVGMFIVFFVV